MKPTQIYAATPICAKSYMLLTAYSNWRISLPMEHTTLFHILSDETRLRALALIHASGELCICELVHALDLPQPKISRHMAAMRDADIVTPRRDAQWVYYAANPALPDWQQQVLSAAMLSLSGHETTTADLARLKTMANRPTRCAP